MSRIVTNISRCGEIPMTCSSFDISRQSMMVLCKPLRRYTACFTQMVICIFQADGHCLKWDVSLWWTVDGWYRRLKCWKYDENLYFGTVDLSGWKSLFQSMSAYIFRFIVRVSHAVFHNNTNAVCEPVFHKYFVSSAVNTVVIT